MVFVRLGIGVVVLGLLVGGFLLLTGRDEAPPQPAAVQVVGEPSAAPAPQVVEQQAPQPQPKPQQGKGKYAVVYELGGEGTATVVYDENGRGLVHQELNVQLPWRKELTWADSGAPPSVQVLGQGSGQVECKVSINGTVVLTHKGEVASCAGKLAPS
ncbi:hypothetical protein SAMN05421504_106199 [Amycolatopsis xylanica]|uniref:MmpS family membrane protein n=1 Tax=Amycolatopsis xylanica TaxID=589385 RepID=A0A1H3LG24_9PSEU|nr:hypothetical protein [Amycolatopsis xylanica]SDY63353.1 hypothetical protein SAMN05421504_106199 [Amycolatopsis xylanica]